MEYVLKSIDNMVMVRHFIKLKFQLKTTINTLIIVIQKKKQ